MSLRIEIDRKLCNGYGNCIISAPQVFDLDPDTNIAYVLDGSPTAADEADVREAAADCPVSAIRIVEED